MAGYAGYSMSNNEISAYADGKIPLSNITRPVLDEYGVQMSVPMFRWLCATVKGFQPCEWHHTGLYFNETYFYDLPAISRAIAKWGDDKRDEMERAYREWRKQQPKKAKQAVDSGIRYARVSYSLVQGAPNRHRRRHYQAYAVVHKGWAYCVTDDGKVLEGKKKLSGANFYVDEWFDEKPKQVPDELVEMVSKLNGDEPNN